MVRKLLVTFVRDEGMMLMHFVKHYHSQVDTILIYDDSSIDTSISEVQKAYKNVETIRLANVPRDRSEFLQYFTNLRNSHLVVATAREFDVVMIVDCDEFLSPPLGFSSLVSYIDWFYHSKFAGVAATGFDIIGLDKQHAEDIPLGTIEGHFRNACRYHIMDKPCIFNTHECKAIAFGDGAHTAQLTTSVDDTHIWCPIAPILLHYKFISLPYARSRCARDSRVIEDDVFAKHASTAINIDNMLKVLPSN